MNEASATGESGKAKVAWTPFQVRDLSSVSDAQSGFGSAQTLVDS